MIETKTGVLLRSDQIGSPPASSPFSPRIRRLVVPLLILSHLIITLILAYKLNIWVDEAFSLNTTGKNVGYAFDQAIHFELQAPLYFVLLSVWRKISASIFFARLFSVLCMALTLKVVAGLSRRFFKGLHPGWVVAGVAFNPFTIYAAVEIRVYALVILLSALLLLCFFDGYLSARPRPRARVLYLLLSILALYTYYYLGFLLVANAFVLLLLRRWRLLFIYLAGMIGVGAACAPAFIVALQQKAAATKDMHDTFTLTRGLGHIFWRIKDYLLPVEWEPSAVWRQWILRFGYIVILFFLIKRKRRSLTVSNIAIWTITVITSLFFLIVLMRNGETLLQSRHTAVLFLPVIFSAFALVRIISRRKALIIWTSVTLFFYATSLYVLYRPMAKYGDWKRVASYLMASAKPGQPILVFHAGAALPLSHYYSGPNPLVPLPRENSFKSFDYNNYALRDEKEISEALSRVPGSKEQLWLVTDEQCKYGDIDYHCEILEDYTGKYYTVESDKRFFHSEVKLLRRRPAS